MTEAEKQFEEYRKSLWEELRRLTSYIRIYARLSQRLTERLEEINIAPHFFSHVRDSLLSSITLWIEKLFGTTSECSLLKFLRFIENNRGLFDAGERARRRKSNEDRSWNCKQITFETIKSDYNRLGEIESLPGFELMRHKFTAHFDKPYFFNKSKLHQETNISKIQWSDFDDYISLGREILNKYSLAYDGQEYEIVDVESFDIDYILDALHEYRICVQMNKRNEFYKG